MKESSEKIIPYNSYFKFVQEKNPEKESSSGKFFYIRFLNNENVFDIYVKNSYETFIPEG